MTAKAQWYSMEGMRNRTKTNCLSYRSLFCYWYCTVSKKQGRNDTIQKEGCSQARFATGTVSKNLKLGAFRPPGQGMTLNTTIRKEGRMFTKACDLEGDTVTKPVSGSKTGSDPPSSQACDLLPRTTPNSEHKFGTSTSVTKLGSQLAKLGRDQILNTSSRDPNSERATFPNVNTHVELYMYVV